MLRLKRKKHQAEDVELDLPITPMLDMAFQLMAFFVFTFRPSPQEGQIAMQLPAPEGGGQVVPLDPNTSLEPPQIFRVQVTDAGGAVETITFIDDQGSQRLDIQPGSLYNKLKSITVPEGDEMPEVKIEATDMLQYSELVRLMDESIKAGYDSVGVAPLGEGSAGGGG